MKQGTMNYSRIISHRYLPYLLGATVCAGFCYIGSKLLFQYHEDNFGFDFRVIWLAGKMWAGGQNPYGPLFAQEYIKSFGPAMNMLGWLYPPFWYPFCVVLGLLPVSVAHVIWTAVNVLALFCATYLVARGVAEVTRQKVGLMFWSGLAFVCLMQATAIAIYIGQTSIFVYLGFSALSYGLLTSRPAAVVIGLFFLALKPHIGVVAFLSTFALSNYRVVVLIAGIACLLSTAPILVGGMYWTEMEGFVRNMAEYPSMSTANYPANLTGIINIVGLFLTNSSNSVINLTCVILGIAFGCFNFYNSTLDNPLETEDGKVAALSLFIASTLFLSPLHGYDLVSLATIAILAFAIPLPSRAAIITGLCLCFHPRNISAVLRIDNPTGNAFPESFFTSVALVIVVIGAIWAVLQTHRAVGSVGERQAEPKAPQKLY
jgi:hypothetical protein